MRIVAALGGNALLERGEPPESGSQEAHVVKAVSPQQAGTVITTTGR
jgi:carbamate kinase